MAEHKLKPGDIAEVAHPQVGDRDPGAREQQPHGGFRAVHACQPPGGDLKAIADPAG
jgi:hypothetical protein